MDRRDPSLIHGSPDFGLDLVVLGEVQTDVDACGGAVAVGDARFKRVAPGAAPGADNDFLGLLGGFLGIIFGMIIGFFGVQGINNFVGATTAPDFNIPLIIFSLLGSFLIGALAGIIPAMRAAKHHPVEALRG